MELAIDRKFWVNLLPLLLCACYAMVIWQGLKSYLIWDLTLVIGIVVLPLTCRIERNNLSTRFLVPAIVFTVCSMFIPVRTMLFFAIIFTVLLLLETYKGKINLTCFFVLILISPLFKFLSDTLGFPLRLWLSDIVAKTLTFAGRHCTASGNVINIDGFDFYIDQACAGLNMLSVSLLISLFIVAFYQKKIGKSLHFIHLIIVLFFAFLMNMISNYSRIVLIVLFKIMPDTNLHYVIGLVSLVVYAIFPLILLTGPYVNRFGQQIEKPIQITYTAAKKNFRLPLIQLILFTIIAFLSVNLKQHIVNKKYNNTSFKGYEKTNIEGNVIKLESKEALIYIKPTAWYAPEHNPMICWKGSGYDFKTIKKETINGTEIYTGILTKGADKIYSSWWFDNGITKTVSPLQWRWEGAKSNNFYLINVNTTKQSDLRKITMRFLPSPFARNL